MFLSTLYLLLAHLIADFLLQPQELVEWKHKSFFGVAIHAGVHWMIMVLLLAPFGVTRAVLAVTFLLALSHFFVDRLKVRMERGSKRYYELFVVDQTVHILLLMMGGYFLQGIESGSSSWVGPEFLHYYANGATVLGLCLVIATTYAYELGLYQFKREVSPGAPFKPNYSAMAHRLLISSIIYGLLLLFGVYKLAAFAL